MRLLCPWDSPGQGYWSGLPFSSPGNLPNRGIKSGSPALQAVSLPSEPPGKPNSLDCPLWGHPTPPHLRLVLCLHCLPEPEWKPEESGWFSGLKVFNMAKGMTGSQEATCWLSQPEDTSTPTAHKRIITFKWKLKAEVRNVKTKQKRFFSSSHFHLKKKKKMTGVMRFFYEKCWDENISLTFEIQNTVVSDHF